MRLRFFRLTFCCVLLLASCASPVPQASYLPAANIPPDAAPAPILFRGAEFLLPVGADIGFETRGKYCGWPRYAVSRNALKGIIDKDYLKQTFREALEGQGYDVTGSIDLAYDRQDEDDRAEYTITAKISGVDLNMCHKDADTFALFFPARAGTKGEFYMKVDWTVYDALHRRVAYKTMTSGYTKRREPNEEGLTLMFTDAFAMAAHNLGADAAFENLIVRGVAPPGLPAADNPERARRFDPAEKVVLADRAPSHTPLAQNSANIRNAAATIEKFGHASGFFLTPQGHILTAASAVGDGLRTRIVTADGKTLIAEVLRTDKIRNVALLKLETMPADLRVATLPIQPDRPGIGEPVYALGTPGGIGQTAAALTGGILSADRKSIRHNGVRQDFLLADVPTGKGSEGGPLLDRYGNVIGLAAGGADSDGLGYFIPIDEALRALDITP